MAALDSNVMHSSADGAENRLLCSSLDKKIAVKDICDQKNNIKNPFMPWQCQNEQDDEVSLKVEIASTCENNTSKCLNSILYKENLEHNSKYDTAKEDQIDLKSNLPKFKQIINDLKENNNPLNAVSSYNCTLCGYECKYEEKLTNNLFCHGIESTLQSEVLKSEKSLDNLKYSEFSYKTINRAMSNKHIIKLKHNTLLCQKCKEKCGSTFDMHKHKISPALGSELVCPLCDYKGHKIIEMKKHLLKHSENWVIQKFKSVFAARKNSTLEKHMLPHTERLDGSNKSEA